MLLQDIPANDFPLIVFADHTYGWVEAFIKIRTKGEYNHVMVAIAPDTFATQGGTYSKQPFKAYMKDGNRLKFVRIIGLTKEGANKILASVEEKLAMPWYRKTYDWLGILGQAIGIKKINSPLAEYCSEDVAQHVKACADTFPNKYKTILELMPAHGSPQDLNEYVKKYPSLFETYLRWDSDAVS